MEAHNVFGSIDGSFVAVEVLDSRSVLWLVRDLTSALSSSF